MKLEFSKTSMKDLDFWRKADKKTAQKVTALLLEIASSPYKGKGKPEALLGNLTGYWSRRINAKDRLIYNVDEINNTIFIRSLRKHYE